MISSKRHKYNRTELPMVGEKVRVKSADEIKKLLNNTVSVEYIWNGKDESLSFTKSMWAFCGHSFTVKEVSLEKGICLLANGFGLYDEWWFCNDMLEWN